MNELNYRVYDGDNLLAGFVSLAVAVDFIENWRTNSNIPMDLVAHETGEVVNTWVNGAWENSEW